MKSSRSLTPDLQGLVFVGTGGGKGQRRRRPFVTVPSFTAALFTPVKHCAHQAQPSGKTPMNQNEATANTAKNGIRQPIAALDWEDTWNDWFGSRGL